METFQLPPIHAQTTQRLTTTYIYGRLGRAGHHEAERVQMDITYSFPSESAITQDLELIF